MHCIIATLNQRLFKFLFAAILLALPMLSHAANGVLLNQDAVRAELKKEPDYQLLDARGAEARRSLPLAFATRYEKSVPVKKGLVLVVADSDDAALEIARAIPVEGECRVFAVQGGADAWKQVQARLATVVTPGNFIVPKGTCDLGKPALRFDNESEKKTGKPALETINK